MYELSEIGENLHEEYGVVPTTDLNYIYIENLEERINNPLVKIGKSNREYFIIYDEIVNLYLKFLNEIMLNYAIKTINSEIEYMNIILRDGSYIILEGDERRVTVPFPKGISTVHTHPGICLFSYKDLETADSLFSIGYVAVAVMNTDCVSFLYRRGVYTFEDKQTLKELANRIKKSKNINYIISIYNSLTFPEYMRFVIYQL